MAEGRNSEQALLSEQADLFGSLGAVSLSLFCKGI